MFIMVETSEMWWVIRTDHVTRKYGCIQIYIIWYYISDSRLMYTIFNTSTYQLALWTSEQVPLAKKSKKYFTLIQMVSTKYF